LAALPAWVYGRILRPAPIPLVALPQPNGYDDIREAGRLLDNFALREAVLAPGEDVRLEIARHQHAFDLARAGLARECRRPVRFDLVNQDMEEHSNMRSLARAFSAAASIAAADGDYARSAKCCLDVVRLGFVVGHGGLMIDGLVAHAIQGIGLDGLRDVYGKLSTDECREAVEVLVSVDRAWEPPGEFVRRDRIWTEHSQGWQGRLEIAMVELSGQEGLGFNGDFVHALQLGQAQRRLCMLHLALELYQAESSRPPRDLAELIPRYLPVIPRDPFGDGTWRYRGDADSWVLYSVGPDGVDNSGRRLAIQEFPFDDAQGDLYLESFFDDAR
jgi:hypothetical protein